MNLSGKQLQHNETLERASLRGDQGPPSSACNSWDLAGSRGICINRGRSTTRDEGKPPPLLPCYWPTVPPDPSVVDRSPSLQTNRAPLQQYDWSLNLANQPIPDISISSVVLLFQLSHLLSCKKSCQPPLKTRTALFPEECNWLSFSAVSISC